jgi:hypothetical protein
MINSGLKRRANIIINYELGIMNVYFSSAGMKSFSFAVVEIRQCLVCTISNI